MYSLIPNLIEVESHLILIPYRTGFECHSISIFLLKTSCISFHATFLYDSQAISVLITYQYSFSYSKINWFDSWCSCFWMSFLKNLHLEDLLHLIPCHCFLWFPSYYSSNNLSIIPFHILKSIDLIPNETFCNLIPYQLLLF